MVLTPPPDAGTTAGVMEKLNLDRSLTIAFAAAVVSATAPLWLGTPHGNAAQLILRFAEAFLGAFLADVGLQLRRSLRKQSTSQSAPIG
jgi:hypothetical protein